MKLSASTIKALWAEFADCPINDHEETLESFCGWPVFTDREEIWRWFDEQYAEWGGVHVLMFPNEHKKKSEKKSEKSATELMERRVELMERRKAVYRRKYPAGTPTAHVYD